MVDTLASVQLGVLGPLRIGYTGMYQSWAHVAPFSGSPQVYVTHYGVLRFAHHVDVANAYVDVQIVVHL